MKFSVSTTGLNEDGSWNITDTDIFSMDNLFGPGREADIQRATEYVERRTQYKFNRSVSICMRLVLALTGALLFVGFWCKLLST